MLAIGKLVDSLDLEIETIIVNCVEIEINDNVGLVKRFIEHKAFNSRVHIKELIKF